MFKNFWDIFKNHWQNQTTILKKSNPITDCSKNGANHNKILLLLYSLSISLLTSICIHFYFIAFTNMRKDSELFLLNHLSYSNFKIQPQYNKRSYGANAIIRVVVVVVVHVAVIVHIHQIVRVIRRRTRQPIRQNPNILNICYLCS